MKECPFCSSCYEDEVLHCPRDKQALPTTLPWPLIINDKYRIDALIGRGGMSSVYRATQLELARSVAIKILLPELLTDTAGPERMRREALASARIDHPNVVTIYDYGTLTSGAGYLVMKLLRGHALSKEIRLYGLLSFERVFNIMLQICSAIDTAHRMGVVHCDLKPDNIILEETDSGDTVQILDFGIAKLRESNKQPSRHSGQLTTGVIFGTPLYMSPEQSESREIDFRTDIYSLGVILYEMLTGRVPFTGNSSAEVARLHLNQPAPPPSALRPEINPKLDQVVLTALAKRRSQRQQSAVVLLEELKAAALELSGMGRLDIEAIPPFARIRGTGRLHTFPKMAETEEQPTLRIEPINTPTGMEATGARLGKTTGDMANPGPESWTTTPSETREPERLDNKVVLIVDDEPSIVLLLKTMLEQLGCQILTADNGRKALLLLEQTLPDLIISDIMMPDMDGYQFYEALQREPTWSMIPFVFLTARTQQQEKVLALVNGVEDYWTKPFDIQEIRLRVRRILQRLHLLKRLEGKH
ncbi:MAG: serine/threonine-protein kinase [Acidobacteriota bacterium]